MAVEIIVRPTLGSYTARAIGHKGTANRSEGARQAASALVFKLNFGDGKLQELPDTDLPQGQQRFCFVSNSEMTECQFHNNCGGWYETQRELEHNLCGHCLETHDEQLALPAEQHQGELMAWATVKPVAPGAYWVRGNGLSRAALIEVAHEHGQLRCNLHDRTTCDDFGFGYSVEQLSDEFEFCGPLYTHADHGEVERLRSELIDKADEMRVVVQRNEGLIRRLAERDALLAIAYGDIEHASKSLGQCVSCGECPEDDDIITHDPSCAFCAIEMALASSGKVSVPLERDERADFEAHIRREWPMAPISRKRDLLPKDDPCYGDYCDEPLQRCWVGWQMRAALERAKHHG